MKDNRTLKWIYARAKGCFLQIAAIAVMRSVVTVLGVYFALASRHIIDAAVAKNSGLMRQSAIVLLGIIATQIAIRFFGQGIETSITTKLTMRIRSRLFGSILERDYSALGGYHSGDLMTRISDDSSIVSAGIISLVPSVLALLVGLGYALWSLMRLDSNFAIIFLAGGIFLLLVISAFRRVMKNMHKRVQEAESKVRSYFQESLSSILMIKVFGIEDTVSKKSDALQNASYKAQMRRRNLSLFASSGLGFIFSIGSLYALVHSAYRLYLGTITFGTLTAIIQLVNQIQSPFAGLSGVIPQFYAILASAERIIEIEDLPVEELTQDFVDPYKDYKGLKNIAFKNITFGYGRDIVLEEANLAIEKGDFAVIAGISGIGKSTLIKLLLGVINPEKGEISLNINDRTVTAGKHTRPFFSYVPQGNLLLSGTIRDAVAVVNPAADDKKIMATADLCCAEFIKDLPEGLDTYVGEKGFGLSEGQIQRLAIMRAVLSEAPILLLDEATSALDEGTEERLLKNIREMKDKTCIIISHKKAAFDICNKHIYIEGKKIRTEVV